jgi:hypothetical protein
MRLLTVAGAAQVRVSAVTREPLLFPVELRALNVRASTKRGESTRDGQDTSNGSIPG